MPNSSTESVENQLLNYDGGEPGRARSTLIALLFALFLHLFLFWMVPARLFLLPLAVSVPEEIELELEIAPLEIPDPEQLRFVEVNPEAPENQPDRKDQYSSRSTQAADQSTKTSILEAPQVDGEVPSQKIIDGILEQPTALSSVVVAAAPAPSENRAPGEAVAGALARAAVPHLPTAEFIKQSELLETEDGSTPNNKDTEISSIDADRNTDGPIALHRNTVGAENQTVDSGAAPALTDAAKPIPQARPRLAPELLTGPIMQSLGSASRRGALSIDATFSDFGEYEQQFYAALQIGWYQEIEFYQPIDTASTVAVRFVMQADGTIDAIKVVQSNASELATLLCESALAKRSPFRSWTKEMIAVFGSERTLTVRFNYR